MLSTTSLGRGAAVVMSADLSLSCGRLPAGRTGSCLDQRFPSRASSLGLPEQLSQPLQTDIRELVSAEARNIGQIGSYPKPVGRHFFGQNFPLVPAVLGLQTKPVNWGLGLPLRRRELEIRFSVRPRESSGCGPSMAPAPNPWQA